MREKLPYRSLAKPDLTAAPGAVPGAAPALPTLWGGFAPAQEFATLWGLLSGGGVALVTQPNTFTSVQSFNIGVPASSEGGALNVGAGGFAGGGSDFSGGSGTLIAGNVPAGYTGDLENLQVGGASKFRVDQNGNIYQNGVLLMTGAGGASLTAANLFTNFNTFTVDDANSAGVTSVVKLVHTVAGGVGSLGNVGIGTELTMATEDFSTNDLVVVQARLQAVTFGTNTSYLKVRLLWQGSEFEAVRFSPFQSYSEQPMGATSDHGLMNWGEGGFNSGAPNFVGNGQGTILAVNVASTALGDLISLQQAGVNRFNVTSDGRVGIGLTAAARPSALLHVSRAAGAPPTDANYCTYLRVTGAADTLLPFSADDVRFDLARTVQFNSGAVPVSQNAVTVTAPTYAGLAAGTITDAATVFINGAPTAGTNVAITNRYSLYVNGMARFDSATQPNVFYLPQNDTPLTGGITGRIAVLINGVQRFIPYYTS